MINNQADKVVLWGVTASPYVRKVMIALAEKEICYEHKEILPKTLLKAIGQPVPKEFERASPLGKIPALQVSDFLIADSAVIAGYLDRKFSTGNKLYPANAEEYAKALWFEHYSDVTLAGVITQKILFERLVKPKVLKQASDEKLVDHVVANELPSLLSYLNTSISNKDWFTGSHFSMADVAIAIQLLALETAEVEMSEQQYPALTKYMKKIVNRKSFTCIKL